MGPRHLAKADAMGERLTLEFGTQAAPRLGEGLQSHFAPGGRRIGYVITAAASLAPVHRISRRSPEWTLLTGPGPLPFGLSAFPPALAGVCAARS